MKIDTIVTGDENTDKNAHLVESFVDVLGERVAELSGIYVGIKSKLVNAEEI